ncbi:MAG: spermidine/putrescine ABC transporter permease PotC [Desulfobulbaceae bacterium]|nr:MAG: spermidine/putrescine ABC transporter permease PotC [Desulfobulbaceae bacterium]
MKPFRIIYLAIVFLYLYIPLAVMVANSFNVNKYGMRWDGFTLQWFSAMLQNHSLMEATRNSLLVAISSATVATVLGGLGATCIYLYRFRGRKVMQVTLLTIMMIPDIILAIGLLVLFVITGVSLGFWSLLLAHVTFCLPFVTVTVLARLQGFDPNLIDAAKDLGASESQTTRHIVIPLLKPALLASWLLSFTLSLDDVIVSSFVTGPSFDVLPLKLFSMVKVGVKPEVNALSTLFVGISVVLILICHYLTKENKR